MKENIFIENGNLVFRNASGLTEKMSLNILEELRTQWETTKRLNQIIQSFASIGMLIVTRQNFRVEELMNDMESIMPDIDSIYMLSMLSEAFGGERTSNS